MKKMFSNEQQKDAFNKGSKIAEEMLDNLNSMIYSEDFIEGFVNEITKSHRTLQQSTMRAVSKLILTWAEMKETGNYDLRNEATVNSCSIMKRSMEENNVCLPFI